MAISFLTDFTPLTLAAMLSAVDFSVLLLAKPDSITTPLRVSTLMLDASTVLVVDEAGLDRGGDGGIVDVSAHRFLAALHGAA